MRWNIRLQSFFVIKKRTTQRTHESEALEIAVTQVLGEEALRYARRNRPSDS